MHDCLFTEFAPAERSTAEELERQRRMFEGEQFFCDMVARLPEVVLVLNGNRQTVFANHAALAMLRMDSLDEALGRRPGELVSCIHARETPGGCGTTSFCRYCGAVNAILQSQEGRPAVDECRLTVERNASQEALDLRVWANPIDLRGERFTVFVVADIADEKRKAFLERLFLHDILNTATAIQGFSQLLGSGVAQGPQREQFAQRVGTLSGRLVEEIHTHRVLIEAENGDLRPHFSPLNVAEILQTVFEAYHRPDHLDQRNLQLAPDTPDLVLATDPVLLGRVLGNMVKNALEASLPGDTVTLGARAKEGGICFWVHNPTAMPERVRLQVFSRSFSTKGAGRGLGTYSMKFLTERYLGGRVEFSSSEAEGTTFRAWYPLG